ncbi:MAG TPA: RsmE family RNA methyltransferase [Candidatus Babeliales bacterium]|nr:RsmE family RNA methyltransferase [Candidatus Babeliales bacterium]
MNGKAAGSKEKHEFALFVESLSSLLQEKDSGSNIIIADEKLVHRIVNVLRFGVGDMCILFDRSVHVSALITTFVGKKQVNVTIQSVQKTLVLQPTITFLLPLLKRDDYESALYALTEVGVSTIQLIFTQKIAHQLASSRDSERAQRILISAAEQSKNFAYPELQEPIALEIALKKYSTASSKIFFDPEGKKFFDVMKTLYDNKAEHVLLLVGPEGDLSLEEKKTLQVNDFIFCALTPTIIRAVQAAALGAGFVRSLLVSTTN